MTPNKEQKMTAEEILKKHQSLFGGSRANDPYIILAAMEEYAAQEAASTQSAGVSKEEAKAECIDGCGWSLSSGVHHNPNCPNASLPSGSKGEVTQIPGSHQRDSIRGTEEKPPVNMKEILDRIIEIDEIAGTCNYSRPDRMARALKDVAEISDILRGQLEAINQPSPDQEQPE